MLLKFMAFISTAMMISAQDRENNILQQGGNRDSQSFIITQKTKAFLSCESGEMVVKVNFTQPFIGFAYAEKTRNSPCNIRGTGGYYYVFRIPLKGCGTWQESPRVFVNNITIRFHPALELEDDETKTIVCRYPPPHTPSPGSIQIIQPPIHPTLITPIQVAAVKLSEVEILIIVCLLLFLSLLILGIGIAYFCLKKKNIHIVRKRVISPAPLSQITKLSGSNPNYPSSMLSSVLEHTVKIPRAIPYSVPGNKESATSDHLYEDYPASTIITETTCSESSDLSSLSLIEDQIDSSRQFLNQKEFSEPILTIPKAVLRTTGLRQIESQHDKFCPARESFNEVEDQIITTMLGSEENSHFKENYSPASIIGIELSNSDKTAIPVYAKVHKVKKLPEPKIPHSEEIITKLKKPDFSSLSGNNFHVKRNDAEEKNNKQFTKNKITLISRKSGSIDESSESPLLKTETFKTATTTTIANIPKMLLEKDSRQILIKDVEDVFLTTTIETELREQKSTVSRNIIEKHTKTFKHSGESTCLLDGDSSQENKFTNEVKTDINEKESSFKEIKLDERNKNGNINTNSPKLDTKPKFNVTIRTRPPEQTKPEVSNVPIEIPQLEIPETVSKLKEALTFDEASTFKNSKDHDKKSAKYEGISNLRTVRWRDNIKASKASTVSSTDSFQSSESLRERSSSEVLEVAPTLPSQQTTLSHIFSEKSVTGNITENQKPDEIRRSSIPVSEHLISVSLSNRSVVPQGGFFNSHRTND